jgi:undecaprenyl-diphosphatase
VVGIALCILLSDQISSSVLKPLVARLRPTHNPKIADLIHVVNGYRGGLYGFVSSHAANAATFVTFTALLFRNKIYTILLSLWAFLTAYSRVYLGVHYVGDVLCGALIGVLVGVVVYVIFKKTLYFKL